MGPHSKIMIKNEKKMLGAGFRLSGGLWLLKLTHFAERSWVQAFLSFTFSLSSTVVTAGYGAEVEWSTFDWLEGCRFGSNSKVSLANSLNLPHLAVLFVPWIAWIAGHHQDSCQSSIHVDLESTFTCNINI